MASNQLSGRATYRQLFSLPAFPRLASGMLLARTGVAMWQVTLVLFVLQRFHDPALAGLAAFLALAPGLLLSPVAGALLDRHGRVRLIILNYAVEIAMLLVIAMLAFTHLLSAGGLLIVVGLSSLTAPLSESGARALFPLVVPRPLWDRANAIDSGSVAVSTVVGPALAGFSLAWLGGELTFVLIAVVMVLAGLVMTGMRDPAGRNAATEPLLSSAWHAFVYVVRHPSLRGLVLTLWLSNLPLGILTVALPVMALRSFHWGTDGVGALWAAAGVASVFAGIIVGRLNSEGRERSFIAVGTAISAVSCVLILFQSPIAVVVALVLYGIAGAPYDIGLFAIRQRRTDPLWFGRVVAISMGLNYAAVPVGSLIAGPLIERSLMLALIVTTVFAICACFAPFLLIPREQR